jgi:hypothetical protein
LLINAFDGDLETASIGLDAERGGIDLPRGSRSGSLLALRKEPEYLTYGLRVGLRQRFLDHDHMVDLQRAIS